MLSHWQRRKLKRKAQREKKIAKAEGRSTSPSSITHGVANTYQRRRLVARKAETIDADLKWFVVQTNIKCERRACGGLRARGIACYMPQERIRAVRRGVRREFEQPVLSRYLFVGLPVGNMAFGDVRLVDGVERILGVCGTPIEVRPDHLQDFEDRLTAKHNREASKSEEGQFMLGEVIKVAEGPFAALNAEIARYFAGDDHVGVIVDIFGRKTSMEMPLAHLVAA